MSRLAVDVLTEDDKQEARKVGMGRFRRALDLQRTQPFGDPGDDKRAHLDCWSALAECFVAKWLGLPWCSEIVDDLTVKPPDVGERIEVRWTAHLNGCLIAHETDAPGWLMVLVRGELPVMAITGWTTTGAAKQPRYQNNPRARSPLDYWVPASDLYLPELLRQMKAGLNV